MRPFIFLLLILCGCSTQYNTATNRQETLLYGDEKEKNIGASMAIQAEKQFMIDSDVDINERVDRILKKIVAVCDRQDLVYTVRVIDEDDVNAFSLPGGYVFLFKGLIERVKNDDQLAAVIAHEVAHVTAKHAMKRLQGAYGAMALEGLAIASGSGAAAIGTSLTASSVFLHNSRDDEFEADRLGIKYMAKAGYDPSEMRGMLAKLLEYQNKLPPRPLMYWRTHPYIPQRMAQASMATGKTEFRDYLNLTGEDK